MQTKLKSFFFRNNLSLINKICLAGLFIALGMILNQIICIKEIPIIPFLKISLGAPAIIIISSLLLGPIFGGLVGGSIDFMGYLLFDIKSFPYFPQISLIYVLLGIFPAFLFGLVKNIKNNKLMLSFEIIIMTLIIALITLFFVYNDDLKLYGKTYHFELWTKLLIIGFLICLSIMVVAISFFANKMYLKHFLRQGVAYKLGFNAYQISFVCFLVEIFIMVLFGTLMKATAFGFNMYMAILICQIITMFFNIPLNILLVSYILLITRKYYLK